MRIGLLILLTLVSFTLFGQQDLPIHLTPAEKALVSQPDYVHLQATAPGVLSRSAAPKRSMAEWEEMEALAVTWTSFRPLLAQIIDETQNECDVIVICNDIDNTINQLMNNYGVTPGLNVNFIEAPYNTVWMRDYGGNPVYANDVDTMSIVDWIYNRPRPLDDALPGVVANFVGVDNFATTGMDNFLVHTGGNFMSDGMGTGFSSRLVVNENGPSSFWIPNGASPIDEQEVRDRMDLYMGIEEYVLMDVLPYDGINHIDMHMKLLDEETILVGEFPQGVSDGPQIEANIQYIKDNYLTPFGNEYRFIRIPMPPCSNGQWPDDCQGAEYRTYTNAMFINNTILVPTYGISMDADALAIWEDAMPGYNIVGLDCTDIIFSGGAIHCITKEVGVLEPLLINHARMQDTLCEDDPTDVAAIIQHNSGIANATLYYTDNLDNGYQSVAMSSGADNNWTATIPDLGTNTHIYYYIEAEANSGKTITRPLPAPTGHFEFYVKQCAIVHIDDLDGPATLLGQVYPNPASALTVVPVEASGGQEGSLTIQDIYGRTIANLFDGVFPEGESNYFFQAEAFQAGIYFVRLVAEGQEYVQKIVIE